MKLQETFRELGLQVIVKVTSIDLTPDRPAYAGDDWKVEGALNEHIAALAIYYFDDDNVTKGHLSFRQKTRMDENDYVYDVSDHGPLEEVFGCDNLRGSPAVQGLGSVPTPDGRLLAWSNALQYRIEPFELRDKSRAGHRRFITLSLVDPHYRICSTRNVPPQQHDWWAEPALRSMGLKAKGIPQEVVDLIDKETRGWPISMDEAQRLREDMLAEKTTIDEAVELGMGNIMFSDN